MKKSILLLSLVYCASIANAQFIESTNYRGAFAPAPTAQWTDTWANFDPQNTVYGATNVTVTGSITTNTTWTKNNVYQLSGLVYVNDGVTLTIEPGTVIRGNATIDNSSLIVARGGKLIADGTACNPIVFTSNVAAGSRNKGDWGGVILLGKAKNNLGTNVQIEGTDASDPRNFHGGTADNDNSGILRYVRIEFPGFIFSINNEINGLTMGSVGNGTTLDYIQVSNSDDDSFEWFGGAVNGKHLIAFSGRDDDFDTDNGFSGSMQFCLGIRNPTIADASGSNGFESDNSAADGTLIPKTSASFVNCTILGPARCGYAGAIDINFRRGAHIRRGSELKVSKTIFMNWPIGVFIDNAVPNAYANMDAGLLQFRDNIITADYTARPTYIYAADAGTRSRVTTAAYGNDSSNTCGSVLVNAFPANYLNPDFRPNPAFSDPNVPGNPLNAQPDLFAVTDIINTLFTANQSRALGIIIGEGGTGITNAPVTLAIGKVPSYNITVPGLTLSATPQSGTNGTSNGNPTNNGDWNFYEDATTVYAVLKPGKVIAKAGAAYLGFTIARKTGTGTGNQTLSVEASGGGDTTPANNAAAIGLTAN